MSTAELRSLGQSIVETCDALDASEAANESLQAQIDAANVVIAGDAKALAALQAAFDAYRASHPDADVREFADFAQQGSTGQFLTGDLVGKGSAVTTLRMKPDTSTKGYANSALVRAGWSGQKVTLAGFTLEGTHQGPPEVAAATEREYHGLISQGGDGSTISDVTITGIPGHGSSPITTGGETASLSLLRGGAHTLTNVQLDGRRGGAGPGVAATLFEMNYTTAPMTWTGGRANYAAGGFGAALFQCSGVRTFVGIDFRFNRKGINLEQDKGGSVRFVGCDFRGITGAAYIAQVSTLGLTVSTKVTFEDCTFDNDLCVVNTYSTAANNGQNGQKDSDIQRIDKGVVAPVGPKFKLTHV